MAAKVTPPDLSHPLVHEPPQANPPEPTTSLGPLEHLVGTWTNQSLSRGGKGGPDNPYSYNLMPLPQSQPYSPYGYILKNFSYYEEITFTAIHGTAPNRGGLGTQVANTLFYEQRVYFAEGPDKDKLVHAENGSWLYMTGKQQNIGPYGPAVEPSSRAPQTVYNLVKQISVPHGNSILAGGRYVAPGPAYGAPTIPPAPYTFPSGVNTSPYLTKLDNPSDYQNPNVAYTKNPNAPLVEAILADPPSSYIELAVDTNLLGYAVTNIPFEQKHAAVDRYFANYWLESFDAGRTYTQLQYSQTILMLFNLQGVGQVVFPHVTTNTMRKL